MYFGPLIKVFCAKIVGAFSRQLFSQRCSITVIFAKMFHQCSRQGFKHASAYKLFNYNQQHFNKNASCKSLLLYVLFRKYNDILFNTLIFSSSDLSFFIHQIYILKISQYTPRMLKKYQCIFQNSYS